MSVQQKRRRSGRSRRSGFALFAVIILLAVMTAAVAVTLDGATESLRTQGQLRSAELVKSGLDHGLNLAYSQLQQADVATLVDPRNDWDLFFRPGDRAPLASRLEFIGPLLYPAAGVFQRQYRIRIGLRPGQRTRAPAGEDVRKAYGQVVEVQVGVEAAAPGLMPAEERVSVGVLLPRTASHAN